MPCSPESLPDSSTVTYDYTAENIVCDISDIYKINPYDKQDIEAGQHIDSGYMHSRCTALSYPVEDIVYNLLIELSYTSSSSSGSTTAAGGAEIGQKPVLLKGLDKRLIEGRTRFIIPRDTLEEWLQEQQKIRGE